MIEFWQSTTGSHVIYFFSPACEFDELDGGESEKVECRLDTDIEGFRALILFGPAADFSSCVVPYEVNCNLDYKLEAEERRATRNASGIKLIAVR